MTAECGGCGAMGAFDIYGNYLCAGCMSTGSEEADLNEKHRAEAKPGEA